MSVTKHKRIATDAQLVEAYARLGNVHKVGAELGMRGGSAHERLVKLGANKPMNVLTSGEESVIRAYYGGTSANDFDLAALAKSLGRTRAFISRKARDMGLTDMRRPMSGATLEKTRPTTNLYSRSKRGRRDDLGDAYFRSSWEANYARYLNWLMARGEIESWSYEPETFWFDKIKRGTRSYLPDFRIVENGSVYFVEIKGWMDAASKTKLNRMRIYHPSVEVRLVDSKAYRALAKSMRPLIPTWEGVK